MIQINETIIALAEKYNDPAYFREDPISFPDHFNKMLNNGKATLQDVEIAGLIAAHLAWGRRCMIVRDCGRAFDEMKWHPYDYVMNGIYRCENASLHRTVKWSEFASICSNLKKLYTEFDSLEALAPDDLRIKVFNQKSNPKSANKKIHMFRRWMVRNDGKVDFGLWKNISPADLIIPLDIHVHQEALEMGLTKRKQADYATAQEITDYLKNIFPADPCKGDFALFGYGIDRNNPQRDC